VNEEVLAHWGAVLPKINKQTKEIHFETETVDVTNIYL
jgi:hypothetical protein